MANRAAPLSQSNATRYLKAAAAAGYGRARLVIHPDGRIEVIAEVTEAPENASPLESWRRQNGQG